MTCLNTDSSETKFVDCCVIQTNSWAPEVCFQPQHETVLTLGIKCRPQESLERQETA